MLWTRESRDSAVGVSARLVSAYRMNAGPMLIIVEFSSQTQRHVKLHGQLRDPRWLSTKSTEQSSRNDLDQGDKTLSYYSFDDAEFNGKLRLKATSANGYRTADLVLTIR